MSSVTLSATQVAYISQYYHNQNFNNPTNLFVGLFNEPNSIYESFLQFNLSTIPAGATITSATLNLYVNKLTSPTVVNQYIAVTPNSASFDPTTLTWSNQPLNNNAPLINQPITTTNVGSYVNINVTSIIQKWLTTPSTNYGFSLTGQTDTNAVIYISGNGNSAQEPQLVVQYTPPSNIVIGTPQELKFTAASTVDSSPITSNNVPVSFEVLTTVGNATTTADYIIQVSNDGTNWYNAMDSHIASATIPSTGAKYILTTNALAKQYRVQMVVGGTVVAGQFDVTPITKVS